MFKKKNEAKWIQLKNKGQGISKDEARVVVCRLYWVYLHKKACRRGILWRDSNNRTRVGGGGGEGGG